MKDINIDDIKISSKLDEVIMNASTEGYENINHKSIKHIKKSVLVKIIAASLGIAILGTSFSDEISATVKLAMFNIENHLNINKDLKDYKTIVNTTVSKSGITVQLNEVILNKDELSVGTTVTSDTNLKDSDHINLHGNIYINGKKISSGASGSIKLIDEYTEELMFTYKLDEEIPLGDLNIELKYDSALLFISDTEEEIKGPWTFEFTTNGDALMDNSASIELNNSFVLENGQKVTLNKYVSNDMASKIYYSIEEKDKDNLYALILKGYDDLGNEVEFYNSYEELTTGMMKNQTKISSEAKTLTLTPYAVAYPKESGLMNHDYKIIGEEFTITTDK